MTEDYDIEALIGSTASDKTAALPDCILAPYTYLESIPSNNKNVRSTFLQAFNELYYHITNQELISSIDEVISIFHNASLLIDDIEDSSNFRRGLPTAHTQFGTPLTINSGNLMYFVALQKATQLPQLYKSHIDPQLSEKVSGILVDEMLNLHHGQGLDIYWRDAKESVTSPPTIEQYLQMIMNKTGGLFRLSVRLLECFDESTPAATTTNTPLANLLGIIYQIRDDYLNLVDPNYSHMKGYTGEDLIEGKLSLPILHCLLNSQDSPIKHVLLMKDREVLKSNGELVARCISYMETETKSLQFTHSLLKQYQQRAQDIILQNALEDCLLLQVVNKLCNV